MLISNIQRFSTKDGPGIRTVIFTKGCPLNCEWCHNPETKSFKNELLFYNNFCINCKMCGSVCKNNCHTFNESGHQYNRTLCEMCLNCAENCPAAALKPAAKEISVHDIFQQALRDKPFWGNSGGITLSGGEPLVHPESVELLKEFNKAGINCIVETCGYIPREILTQALPFTDLFYWDIKDGRSEHHKKETGVYPDKIINNLLFADSEGAKTVIRCPVVKGVNDTSESFEQIACTVSKLKNIQHIELIKYHAMGGAKQTALNKPDTTDKRLIPDTDDMNRVKNCLNRFCSVEIKI